MECMHMYEMYRKRLYRKLTVVVASGPEEELKIRKIVVAVEVFAKLAIIRLQFMFNFLQLNPSNVDFLTLTPV